MRQILNILGIIHLIDLFLFCRLFFKVALLYGSLHLALCQEGVRDDSHVENVVHKAVADEFDSQILTNR